jgi:predicted metal-dependent phosphoesterase TrpH
LKKFDLHVHTVRGSSDSSLTPEQLIEEAQRIGLDGVCLTEHGGGWETQDLEDTFRDAGLTVIRALEVDTDMGHILAYGLHRHVSGINVAGELRKAVNRAGGVMISAHPFRNLFNKPPYNVNLLYKNSERRSPETAEEASGHPLFQLVDDIEVANGSNTDQENLFTLEVAAHLGMGGTGGSDVHSTHGLGKCITMFDGDIRGESDLIEALKAKAFKPGQNLHKGDLQPFSL